MKQFSLVDQSTPTMHTSTVSGRARIMWCMRLHSALRTAVACAVVGGATLYGPKFLVEQVKFPAFSYLTAVLIVSDASLGDTFKGCWHAICATVQVVPVAMLARWLVDDPHKGLPVGTAALAVAVAAFVVALPEWTHLTAKRIAFGQIVLVCTDAALVSGSGPGFMRPVSVAASTGLGALASVVALMVPYPDLACHKVKRLCRVYAENASERMNLYLQAFNAEDNHAKMELISQAKPIAETGTKLIQSIKILEEGMKWERPWSRYSESTGPEEKLRRMEQPMRGIEYSLVSSPELPAQSVDKEQLSSFLQGVSVHLQHKTEQLRRYSPSNSVADPETRGELKERPLLPLEPIHNHNWILFFFSCIDMLLNDTPTVPEDPQNKNEETEPGKIQAFKDWIRKLNKKLEFAFKCSLSLGLAVLFGLIFDKENGCWAGLTIAISFVTGRQAVFTIANTRAQGTAIGSVYGVICCFLFHYEDLRLLALLPWIIFTDFLRHSRMYGQTGGISAAIGALLILGRKDYGAPNEFAVARLAEVFIGLAAFIMVEMFLQPSRAATLARNHLYTTLNALQDCIKETRLCMSQKNNETTKFLEFRDKQKNLKSQVQELTTFVEYAEMEPSFWYLPFRTCSYQKLVGSLSNIADMLYFLSYNFEILSELSQTSTDSKDFQEQMNIELELYQESLSSSMKYLEKSYLSESQSNPQGATDGKFRDLEASKLENRESVLITEDDTGHCEKLKGRMIQCLGSMGFCLSSIRKEIDDIDMCIKEIDRWENHHSSKQIAR